MGTASRGDEEARQDMLLKPAFGWNSLELLSSANPAMGSKQPHLLTPFIRCGVAHLYFGRRQARRSVPLHRRKRSHNVVSGRFARQRMTRKADRWARAHGNLPLDLALPHVKPCRHEWAFTFRTLRNGKVNRLLRHKNHLRNCAIEARASSALYYSTATKVDVAAGSTGSTALCLSFDDNLISDCVSVAPQTPQAHTTAEPGDTLAVVCGFHFFDISPLHCGQIMMDQSPLAVLSI